MLDIILTSVITVLVFMIFMFTIAQILKNNSIVDIGWGIGFILISVSLLFTVNPLDAKDLLISAMIAVWGLRLAIHIFMRAKGKPEDFRYAQWRKDWGDKAVIYAFFKVFMLQGIIMLFVALPIIVVFNSSDVQLTMLSFTGLLIFIVGFLFESIGDYQVYCFKKNPENKGKIITIGLWKYTRHPNYFGETLLWWGIGIFTLGSDLYWLAFISPLLINFLLVKVSGVPMLEKKYEGREDWEEYKKITPAFVPFIGKKG
ncbi:DUF1295 domain-containing protein [Bacteroidota bacterium]